MRIFYTLHRWWDPGGWKGGGGSLKLSSSFWKLPMVNLKLFSRSKYLFAYCVNKRKNLKHARARKDGYASYDRGSLLGCISIAPGILGGIQTAVVDKSPSYCYLWNYRLNTGGILPNTLILISGIPFQSCLLTDVKLLESMCYFVVFSNLAYCPLGTAWIWIDESPLVLHRGVGALCWDHLLLKVNVSGRSWVSW